MTEDEFDKYCENLDLIIRVRAETRAEDCAEVSGKLTHSIQNMMDRFHISREEAISLLDFGPEYYTTTTTTAQ